MAGLGETPNGERIRIVFLGLRNAGKSTLVNAFAGQTLSIVSPTAGTTTDPVSKAMEIAPLGACLITDTAGLDDEGELGAKRVARTLAELKTADVAVWVESPEDVVRGVAVRSQVTDECARRGVPLLAFARDGDVEELRRRIAALDRGAETGLLNGLVAAGDRVLCVSPIDAAAPKARLILPQQQVIRECLDRGAVCTVCRPSELAIAREWRSDLVITDSQAFAAVAAELPREIPLTSFSILFARAKGDLKAFREGLKAVRTLKPGARVLIAEACTHHRQCEDIGSVKIPRALERLSHGTLDFTFASGGDFPEGNFDLIVQCGGCMLTRRQMLARLDLARVRRIPVVNYGILLAAAAGLKEISEAGLIIRKEKLHENED